LDLGTREARTIASAVASLGRDGRSIDFSRVRDQEEQLRDLIYERFATRYFIHHVEILDRFGVRQFFLARDPESPDLPLQGEVPADWPASGGYVARAPLQGAEGEVKVGLDAGPVLDQLEELSDSLLRKIAVATALAVGVLAIGLFYILRLVRKNRRLEQARESAARASYVGLLASGLAHEIRNPLNAMNMNLQMLEEELMGVADAGGDYAELLDSTKREIKRLDRVVNNFLSYARPTKPTFVSCDLNAVVQQVILLLQGDFKRKGVALESDFESLLPAVELDETQFKQALINLLVNARQVLEEGGRVDVRTRPGAGGDVILEIEDNGPGIPADAHDRVFEVFYSRRGGGTGLGLPIARQNVERHGGRIELDSVEGRGTIFRIHLPRRHAAADQAGLTAGSPGRGKA